MSSKSEMVGVRLPPEDVSAIDLLVEGGVFKTRSEAICSILHQALQVIPIAKMAPKLQEIKKLREEATIELTDLGKQMRKHTVEAFGEEYVLKKPYVGVEGDSEGYIGLDSEKMELVTNYGKTRVPLFKDGYDDEEKRFVDRYYKLFTKGIQWMEEMSTVERWNEELERIQSVREESITRLKQERERSLKLKKRLEEILQ